MNDKKWVKFMFKGVNWYILLLMCFSKKLNEGAIKLANYT